MTLVSLPHANVALAPVPVLLNAVATPLASLPVARVPEGLGGLRGTVEDAKPVPQTGLKIALVHLISAIPRERCTNGWSHLKELSPEDTPPPTFPLQAKGHLLTDAVLAHPAFPPVALVTVKLVLRGLGHQADAKAVLQALVEIPHVVPSIWPLQGSPGTQEVHSIRPPDQSPDSCIPRALRVTSLPLL